MTASTHTKEAYLLGSPRVELSVIGGRITLDAGRAPHVQARLDLPFPGHWESAGGGSSDPLTWVPDEDTLTALDPREGARIRIEVHAIFPGGAQHRELTRRSVTAP